MVYYSMTGVLYEQKNLEMNIHKIQALKNELRVLYENDTIILSFNKFKCHQFNWSSHYKSLFNIPIKQSRIKNRLVYFYIGVEQKYNHDSKCYERYRLKVECIPNKPLE